MTEQEIILALSGWTDKRKFPFQLPNSFIYSWECDYWTMTSGGETREFEIKISRSDFLADAKKEKHKSTEGANFFYYVCPEGLIKLEEIDKRYGLIYIKLGNCIEIRKRPVRLNNNRFDRWQMLANKLYTKWYVLWRAKFESKELTYGEYHEGFNMREIKPSHQQS